MVELIERNGRQEIARVLWQADLTHSFHRLESLSLEPVKGVAR